MLEQLKAFMMADSRKARIAALVAILVTLNDATGGHVSPTGIATIAVVFAVWILGIAWEDAAKHVGGGEKPAAPTKE